MKINFYKIALVLYLSLILIGSSVYFVFHFFYGQLNMGFEKAANLVVVILMIFVCITSIIVSRKILLSFPFVCFILALSSSLLISVLFNSYSEFVPSLLRYSLYLLSFQFGHIIVSKLKKSEFLKYIEFFLVFNIVVIMICVSYELFIGVDFYNDAYRVSGPFKGHSLAFALYIYTLIVIWVQIKMKKISIFKYLFFFLFMAIFISTHSRVLLLVFLFSHFLFVIVKSRNLITFARRMVASFILLLVFFLSVAYTNIFPRMRLLIDNNFSFSDSSTQTRVEIIKNSIEGIPHSKYITGIGMGGFNKFYESITGISDIAPHNNYLMFFMEGGILSLIVYILFQVITFVILTLKVKRKLNNEVSNIAFVLFLSIEISSFLLNNYYFYCSEAIVWLFLGAAFIKRYDTISSAK